MKQVILLSLVLAVLSDQIPFPFNDPFFKNVQVQNTDQGATIIRFSFNPFEQPPVPLPMFPPQFCCGPPVPPPFMFPNFPQIGLHTPDIPTPFSGTEEPQFFPATFDEPTVTEQPQPFDEPATQAWGWEIPAAEVKTEEIVPTEVPTQTMTEEEPKKQMFDQLPLVDNKKTEVTDTPIQESSTPHLEQISPSKPLVTQTKTKAKDVSDDDNDDDQFLPSWAVFLIFVSIFASIIIVSKVIQKVKERRRQQAHPYDSPINPQNLAAQIQFHYAEAKRLEMLEQEQQRLQYENSQGPIGYMNTNRSDYALPRPNDPTNVGYGRFA